jgi:hypothetical protein
MLSACAVDTAGLAPVDAGAGEDAGAPIDARAAATDAGLDAGAGDAGTDGGALDAGALDAGEPDAGEPRPCDEVYVDVTRYMRCDERPMECEFFARLDGGSCADVCEEHGETCIDALPDMNSCVRGGPEMVDPECDDGVTDAICICSRTM